MLGSSWAVAVVGVVCVVGSVALRSGPSERAPSKQQITWIKATAALRLLLVLLVALLSFIPLLELSSSLPLPAQWAMGVVTTLCLLACLANTAAGLWLLSPFVGVDLGLEVVASKRRGTVRSYGLTRLEVSTPAGGAAHLPYLRIVCRPLIVFSRDVPRSLELTLQQEHWSEDEVRFLRQAAILSPYRDLASPVRVCCRAHVLTVELGLAQRSSEQEVRRQLELALATFQAQARRPARGHSNELP
jgi:hypothetical protein